MVCAEHVFSEDDHPMELIEKWAECKQTSQLYVLDTPCWPDGGASPVTATRNKADGKTFTIGVTVRSDDIARLLVPSGGDSLLQLSRMELHLQADDTTSVGYVHVFWACTVVAKHPNWAPQPCSLLVVLA